MDLTQRKLTKEEWDNIEIPVENKEKQILNLIHNGYVNTNISYNNSLSLLKYTKISFPTPLFHTFIFNKYFKKFVDELIKTYEIDFKYEGLKSKMKLKKGDTIRLNSLDKKINNKNSIYEYILLEIVKKLLKKEATKYLYNLSSLLKNNIESLNITVLKFAQHIKNTYQEKFNRLDFIKNAYKYIENNTLLSKYKDFRLYPHQKNIFDIMHKDENKLILYQAPTGTGKTLTPVGLTREYTVLFVCAAKHIGLQLAKSCISMEIPIGIAFGCEVSADIRLHYYAAKDFVRHRRTGGIFKVDNENGEKVKLIVSDVQSVCCAMNYLMAFNEVNKIVLYWDEPTITLDYKTHDFHTILKNNWNENLIPNIILSSATLPNKDEINGLVSSYSKKFPNGNVYEVKSYECDKTIPLVNNLNEVCLPHLLYDYNDMKLSVSHMEGNNTILRYLDFKAICECISYLHKKKLIIDNLNVNNYFTNFDHITISSIKSYYLHILNCMDNNTFNTLKEYCNGKDYQKYGSTIKLTTDDAKTLTGGPTIFLVDNVDKIALFYLKASNISPNELNYIMTAINKNTKIKEEIQKLEKELQEFDDKLGSKLLDKQHSVNSDIYKFHDRINKEIIRQKAKLEQVELDNKFIPNRQKHYNRFHSDGEYDSNMFTCDIDEDIVEEIMMLNIKAGWKILLMLGIGIFKKNNDIKYAEIMKKLAYEQKLFVIVASSDYIYGTNYQFCHGYIGKDLKNMTQEKIIQAFGRVGRQGAFGDYSIRIRDNAIINKLFFKEENKMEVINMNKLFCE